MSRKRQFIRWAHKLSGRSEGEYLAWWVLVIQCILYPFRALEWLVNKHAYVRYDALRNSVRIGKCDYSVEFFDSFESGFPLNVPLVIESRDPLPDGTVIVRLKKWEPTGISIGFRCDSRTLLGEIHSN